MKKRWGIIVSVAILFMVLFFILLSVKVSASSYNKGSCTTFPSGSWESASASSMGLDESKLAELKNSVGGRGAVYYKGKKVYSWGDTSAKGDIASASKPILSLILFYSIATGRITDVNTKLSKYLGSCAGDITFFHVANMMSGYALGESPGAKWAYNDRGIALYGKALFEKAWGNSAQHVFNFVFSPLGFQNSPTMNTGAKSGRLTISTNDLARIGLFISCRGNWNGNQIIPDNYFDNIKNQVPSSLPVSTKSSDCSSDPCKIGTFGGGCNQDPHGGGLGRYGFNFWVYNEEHNRGQEIPSDTLILDGHGGKEVMIIIPSLDIIAVGFSSGGGWKAASDDSSTGFRKNVKFLMDAVGESATVYPACGSANGISSVSLPTENLCSVGTLHEKKGDTEKGGWFWGCVGSNTNWPEDTAWCFAPKSLHSPITISPSIGALPYKFQEIKQLSNYLWFMATVGDRMYSGVYSSPQYFYYSDAPFSSWTRVQIASDDESTRVYNLNNKFYATSEGGIVWTDNGKCFDLEKTHSSISGEDKNHYTLTAEYYNGMYLIGINPKAYDRTELYSCPCSGGQTCTKWKDINDIFTFHTTEYKGDLYLIGTAPGGSSHYRTSNEGRVKVIRANGNIETLISSGPGSGVRAQVFDNKIFWGFAYDAEVWSYDGTTKKQEKTFPGMDHFGDFEIFNNKLFIAVVNEQGNPEIWYRNSDANGGNWVNAFTQAQLSKYGVSGNLVNSAGFFTLHGDSLYFNINSPGGGRGGPGYIIRIYPDVCTSYVYSSWGLCINGKQTRTITASSPSGCSGNANSVLEIDCGACVMTRGDTHFWGLNNTIGLNNGDSRFYCLNNRFYECGWDVSDDVSAHKAINNYVVGRYKCDLANKDWIPILSTLPTCTESDWSYTLFPIDCPETKIRNKTWHKISDCEGGVNHADEEEKCVYVPSILRFIPFIPREDSDKDGVVDSKDKCPESSSKTKINNVGCNLPKLGEFESSSSNLSNLDTDSISNFILENTEGVISFKESVNLVRANGEVDIASYVKIESHKIEIDSAKVPELNKKALLIFKNVSLKNPIVLVDGVKCLNCTILNYDNASKSFYVEVNHFTTYTLVEKEDFSVLNCIPNWVCENWSECSSNLQDRICLDSNNCNVSSGKPSEEKSCDSVVLCVPDWSCSNWSESDCSKKDGYQTRTCTDNNNCNDDSDKPEESVSCPEKQGFNWILWVVIGLFIVLIVFLVWWFFFKNKREENKHPDDSFQGNTYNGNNNLNNKTFLNNQNFQKNNFAQQPKSFLKRANLVYPNRIPSKNLNNYLPKLNKLNNFDNKDNKNV